LSDVKPKSSIQTSKSASAISVLTKALNYLNRRELSVSELLQKLNKLDYNLEEINKTLDQLQQQGFLDDTRLAENLIRQYKSIKGIRWINQKLIQRQIPRLIIDNLKNTITVDENTIKKLRTTIQIKYDKDLNWERLDPKTRNKVLIFLQSRGFYSAYQLARDIFMI
jgi:SOS response regulatory protein OraA/RecX